MNKDKKKFLVTLLIALVIKLSLFVYAEINAPQAKFQIDTEIYKDTAYNLAKHGAFTTTYNEDGSYSPELLRTPGYPVFLAIFHEWLRVPFNLVVLIQVFLTILVALITYKTAFKIDPGFAYLSALIVLYDPPVTIFSMMLLTETLFLFLVSIFMILFISYLKQPKLKLIILCALIIAISTYVRPVAYFLGLAIGIFLIYFAIRTKNKKSVIHLLVFLTIIYSLIGLWHLRNYRKAGDKTFSQVVMLASWYRKAIRSDNEITKSLPPIPYYMNAVARSFMSLMTRPGTLKNFSSGSLKELGKFYGYPWVVFWMIGFIVGVSKVGRNIYLQFLLFVVLYFICASIAGVLFGVSPRQRVPMVPFIAILSAYGWMCILNLIRKKESKNIERIILEE